MQKQNYRDALASLLSSGFVSAGYTITTNIQLDPVPESAKYDALIFGLNDQNIVYRKANVTIDRPGAFLAIWQRPSAPDMTSNKPIPLTANELDYLFVRVEQHSTVKIEIATDDATRVISTNESINHPKQGMFVFPVSLLIEKGIIASEKTKGKTGFRVFPPWSQDRGVIGTQVFSESGKKTQRWQLAYFIAIDNDGLIDACKLNKIFSHQ